MTAVERQADHGQPVKDREPIVVALLYNTNGMATWCWEAAHGLHESGRDVILCVTPGALLPGAPQMELLLVEPDPPPPAQRNFVKKATKLVRRTFSVAPDVTLSRIHQTLTARGIHPSAYVLNQSTLVDRRVSCKQLVAGWAYPINLLGYIRKTKTMAAKPDLVSYLRAGLEQFGWWRKDWRSFREADRVLSVTVTLASALAARGIRARVAYPGTRMAPFLQRKDGPIRLLIAAESLNAPRKRVIWMLEALRNIEPVTGIVLQLVGIPDDAVRVAAAQCPISVEFLGRLRREELEAVMQNADVFLFGSVLDDYGYVLVEAMANGLVPVAPALLPFSEMLGDVGICYDSKDKDSFAKAVNLAVSSGAGVGRRDVWNRANITFSREAFARSILDSL